MDNDTAAGTDQLVAIRFYLRPKKLAPDEEDEDEDKNKEKAQTPAQVLQQQIEMEARCRN